MRLTLLVVFLAGCAAATAGTYYIKNNEVNIVINKNGQLEREVTQRESELLGYTKYTTYLSAGKQSLEGQTKLLAATVRREYNVTQAIERSLLGFKNSGTVSMWFKAEFSFGYDLRANDYDIKAVPNGIEVHIGRPVLVALPAVTDLRSKVLAGGILLDEQGAIIRLYELASKNAQEQGLILANDPAIAALCEKQLISFLRGFLAKQPGVKNVPNISVVYSTKSAPV